MAEERTEEPTTEQQLAAYEARTASGAALKERLEAATRPDTQEACPTRRTVLR
jgi:hypothetical protein